eukprot:TRINITY_DN741_c0_g1_i1.p1 TRINITY_DN741_c0_g1~~TRINITY_DN741_c0_g1_i1.p1  ORF type:complete len:568 (-),score=118.62 TRINITY_DN741_c0_g1_i1:283-1986(-)
MSFLSNLTSEEAALHEKFNAAGVDSNGRLDKAKITKLLEDMGKCQGEIEWIFAKAGNPPLTFHQLNAATSATPKVLTEPELECKFAEYDTSNKGILPKAEVMKAFYDLGKTDEQIKRLVDEEYPQKEYSKRDFVFMGSQHCSVDDVSFVGVFTAAGADTLGNVTRAQPTREEAVLAFKRFADSAGKCDQTDVANASRSLGKSERQVQKLVDAMSEPALDEDGFLDLLFPTRPWMTKIPLGFFDIPVPNVGKVKDVPVLGNVIDFTGHILAEPYDSLTRCYARSFVPPDRQLRRLFNEMKDPKTNKASDKKAIATAIRKRGRTETEIKEALDNVPSGGITLYEFKKAARGEKFIPSCINSVPLVGGSMSTNMLGDCAYSEKDIEEVWDYVCNVVANSTDQKLDKTEVADVCRELGMGEHRIQKLVHSYPEEDEDGHIPPEEITLAQFNDVLEKARPYYYTSWVPNPRKIHDVPIVGGLTGFVDDSACDTASAVKGLFVSPSDEVVEKAFSDNVHGKEGLSTKELRKALRAVGKTELEIKNSCKAVHGKPISLNMFKAIVKGVKFLGVI